MMSWQKSADRAEQILLLIAGAWLVYRLWPADFTYASFDVLLLLASEGLAILFLLLRKGTADISLRPIDWIVALIGSAGPLFVGVGGAPIAYDAGVFLLFAGILVHIGAKLSLNFSFGIVAANRGVKLRGLYAVVRHPMYLGYMVTHVGFLLAAPSLRNAMLYMLVWTAFIARILAEEKILTKDQVYRDYRKRVRYRLVPFIF